VCVWNVSKHPASKVKDFLQKSKQLEIFPFVVIHWQKSIILKFLGSGGLKRKIRAL